MSLQENLPVLDRNAYLSRLRECLEPMLRIKAFYSSLVNGVVTDPELMTVPIFDHAIVRGHAVFDNATVSRGRIYRLDAHLDRLLLGAERARIPLPYGEKSSSNKDTMVSVIAQTVVAAGLREGKIRVYLSAGPGNFGVTPKGCTSAFYVAVFDDDPALACDCGVHEFTVDVPLKPELLATIKSNNYILNVLTKMASEDKGGSFGILVDPDGNVAESCVKNVMFVTVDRRLVTPPFDGILAGTTVRKLLSLAEELVGTLLSAVSQEVVPAADAHGSLEMFLVAGDDRIVPVLSWDGQTIGAGECGPVTKRLGELLRTEITSGSGDHLVLTYPDCI